MSLIADLVEESTTTTGTGALTLAARPGRIRFSAAFSTYGSEPAASLLASYAVVHLTASPVEYEYGYGYASDADTWVRTTVRGGSNGTSPVNFSAGDKLVLCDIPSLDRVRRVDLPPYARLKVGATVYWSLPGVAYTGSVVSQAIAAGAIYYMPIRGFGQTIDSLKFDVVTNVNPSVTRVGIYETNADLNPAALVYGSGEIDTSATGIKTTPTGLAITLARGKDYHLAVTSNGALSLRTLRCSPPAGAIVDPAVGATPFVIRLRHIATGYQAFADPGLAVDSPSSGSTGFEYMVFCAEP